MISSRDNDFNSLCTGTTFVNSNWLFKILFYYKKMLNMFQVLILVFLLCLILTGTFLCVCQIVAHYPHFLSLLLENISNHIYY